MAMTASIHSCKTFKFNKVMTYITYQPWHVLEPWIFINDFGYGILQANKVTSGLEGVLKIEMVLGFILFGRR